MRKQRSLAESLVRSASTGRNWQAALEETRIEAVPLADIEVGERLRAALDDAVITSLGESMAARGLQSPVVLNAPENGRFMLIAGAHRLEAAKRLGWDDIPAIVLDVGLTEARLIEIDENLARAELSALDRAVFLKTRKALYERFHPNARRRGGDRKSSKAGAGAPAFTTEVSARVGLSARAVRRAVAIGEGLDERLVEALGATPIAGRERVLHRLARLPRATQRRAAAQVKAGADAVGTINSLLTRGGQNLTPPALTALKQVWRRADPRARRDFLAWIGEQ